MASILIKKNLIIFLFIILNLIITAGKWQFFFVLLHIIIVKNWQRIQENWLSTHIMMKLMYMYIAFSPLPFRNYISQVTTLFFNHLLYQTITPIFFSLHPIQVPTLNFWFLTWFTVASQINFRDLTWSAVAPHRTLLFAGVSGQPAVEVSTLDPLDFLRVVVIRVVADHARVLRVWLGALLRVWMDEVCLHVAFLCVRSVCACC